MARPAVRPVARWVRALLPLALAAALLPAARPAGAGDLTPAEARGKRLYLQGESSSGEPVAALMGDAGIEVPATALPCASCHGRDGRGRPEGGVEPSDLTWDALSRPYTVTTRSGRERGPYTPRLVQRAVVLGLDSAGNELDTVMPRYRLRRQDADDLVAYLRRLGDDRDPGVAEDAVTVGVLLPPEGAEGLAATARAVRRVVDAYTARRNAAGGVYQRALAVRYLPLPPDPAAWPEAVAGFLDAEGIFALVASFTAGADRELARLAGERGVPSIGPLTLHPDEGFPLNRQVFYLDGGLPARARALVAAAADRPREEGVAPRVAAIVHPEEERMRRVADAAAERAGDGFDRVERLAYPPGGFDPAAAVEHLRALGVGDVFLLTPGPVEAALLDAAAGAGWAPRLHALGSLVGSELFAPRPGYGGRFRLAFGSLPVDRTPPGLERFRDALGGAGIEAGAAEIAAFNAVDLLVDGLERVGRDLSREALIERLELLRDHPTGLTRPLSFGPNRRVGVRGAYVAAFDPAHPGEPPAVAWVEP